MLHVFTVSQSGSDGSSEHTEASVQGSNTLQRKRGGKKRTGKKAPLNDKTKKG